MPVNINLHQVPQAGLKLLHSLGCPGIPLASPFWVLGLYVSIITSRLCGVVDWTQGVLSARRAIYQLSLLNWGFFSVLMASSMCHSRTASRSRGRSGDLSLWKTAEGQGLLYSTEWWESQVCLSLNHLEWWVLSLGEGQLVRSVSYQSTFCLRDSRSVLKMYKRDGSLQSVPKPVGWQ